MKTSYWNPWHNPEATGLNHMTARIGCDYQKVETRRQRFISTPTGVVSVLAVSLDDALETRTLAVIHRKHGSVDHGWPGQLWLRATGRRLRGDTVVVTVESADFRNGDDATGWTAM